MLQGQRWSPRLQTPCLMFFLLHSLIQKIYIYISLGSLKTWSLGRGCFAPQTGLRDGPPLASPQLPALPEGSQKPLPTAWQPFSHSP